MDTLNASGRLRRLRDLGLVDQQGAGASIYYVLGPKIHSPGAKVCKRPEFTSRLRPELTDALCTELASLRRELIPPLVELIDKMGKRASSAVLDDAICTLCNLEAAQHKRTQPVAA